MNIIEAAWRIGANNRQKAVVDTIMSYPGLENNPIVATALSFRLLIGPNSDKFRTPKINPLIFEQKYPLNNAVRHLIFLFMFRFFPDSIWGFVRDSVYSDISGMKPHLGKFKRESKPYSNRLLDARMNLPLLNEDVYARIAEKHPVALQCFIRDLNLARSLNIKQASDGIAIAADRTLSFLNRDISDHFDKWFHCTGVFDNPYLTDDAAEYLVDRYCNKMTTTDWRSLCINQSISFDCIDRIFNRMRSPDYKFYWSNGTDLVFNRDDVPPEKIPDGMLVQRSTEKQVVRYVRQFHGIEDRIAASKHPNMPDWLYAKLLRSKREMLRQHMLSFDRTDPYYILQNKDESVCKRRIDIERYNAIWKPVLDRQLALANDPDRFFPQLEKDAIFEAIESFNLK